MIINRICVVEYFRFVLLICIGGNQGVITGKGIGVEETTSTMNSSIETIKSHAALASCAEMNLAESLE